MAALTREFDGRPLMLVSGVLGAIGAIGVAVGIVVAPERALAAYLAAWTAVATTAIGALAMLLIAYAAGARWFIAVRRLAEAIAAGLVPLAVLALPLLVGAHHVWPWTGSPPNAYLSLPFFVVRTAVYMGVFITAAELLRRWSLRAPDPLGRERTLASAFLPVTGLALTFASFDWLMSLEAPWWSSAFGLYVICGALLAGTAAIILLAWRGVAAGALPIGPGTFHALGRVLHAFVILWAYIAYFQAMLIQIANKPSEVTFYVDRSTDGWRIVTALLLVTLFAIPFPLLVPRRLKRRAGYLGAIAIVLLVGHYIDMWWLVIPHLGVDPIPSWTDAAALLAVAGLTTCVCAWRMRGHPMLPIGDPNLPASLAYETTT